MSESERGLPERAVRWARAMAADIRARAAQQLRAGGVDLSGLVPADRARRSERADAAEVGVEPGEWEREQDAERLAAERSAGDGQGADADRLRERIWASVWACNGADGAAEERAAHVPAQEVLGLDPVIAEVVESDTDTHAHDAVDEAEGLGS